MRRLPMQAKFLKQCRILINVRIIRRQQFIPIKNGIRSGLKHEILLGLRKTQASSRQSHHSPRHDNPSGGNHTRHIERINLVYIPLLSIPQGRSLDAHQRINRHALGMLRQCRQHMQQSNPIRFLLPQTQYTPTTNANARIPYIRNGLQSILVTPGANHLGIMLRTSIQIMIVRGEAGFLELLGLRGVEHSEGAAYLETHGVHAAYHFENVAECSFFVSHFAPCGSHAKAGGPGFFGAGGGFEDCLYLHGRCWLDKCLMPRALTAIRTILRASARLDTQQGALLHLGGIPIHAMHCCRTVHQFMERKGKNFGYFFLAPIVSHSRFNP
mmetsp:Transcript_46281/g.68250  ORF Transcript_46281/g.68250 Transcript_46281/m.68250 type:complete len:327 (-) Transcript_46281:419-1399(-)